MSASWGICHSSTSILYTRKQHLYTPAFASQVVTISKLGLYSCQEPTSHICNQINTSPYSRTWWDSNPSEADSKQLHQKQGKTIKHQGICWPLHQLLWSDVMESQVSTEHLAPRKTQLLCCILGGKLMRIPNNMALGLYCTIYLSAVRTQTNASSWWPNSMGLQYI